MKKVFVLVSILLSMSAHAEKLSGVYSEFRDATLGYGDVKSLQLIGHWERIGLIAPANCINSGRHSRESFNFYRENELLTVVQTHGHNYIVEHRDQKYKTAQVNNSIHFTTAQYFDIGAIELNRETYLVMGVHNYKEYCVNLYIYQRI